MGSVTVVQHRSRREQPSVRRTANCDRQPANWVTTPKAHEYDWDMTRAVVVGNGGGGKSTLSRALAKRHNLTWCSVDQIQWAPDWEPVPDEVVVERLRSVIAGDRWIIDGWGPWPSLEERMQVSDTLIFVDLPVWMHFWLAAERHFYRSGSTSKRPRRRLRRSDRNATTVRNNLARRPGPETAAR